MSDDPQCHNNTSTWEGARREQLRRWRKLTLSEKLAAVDQLNELGANLIAARKAKGLPYIDPETGNRIPKQSVAETPDPYNQAKGD